MSFKGRPPLTMGRARTSSKLLAMPSGILSPSANFYRCCSSGRPGDVECSDVNMASSSAPFVLSLAVELGALIMDFITVTNLNMA